MSDDTELERLRRENAELRAQNEQLKGALAARLDAVERGFAESHAALGEAERVYAEAAALGKQALAMKTAALETLLRADAVADRIEAKISGKPPRTQ